jgi:hypothetical protein
VSSRCTRLQDRSAIAKSLTNRSGDVIVNSAGAVALPPFARGGRRVTIISSLSRAHLSDDGEGNTIVAADASNQVILHDVAVSTLHASNFIFV